MPRRAYRKKRVGAKKGYKLNKNQKKEVKQMINKTQELKWKDIGGSPTVDITPTIAQRFAIVQGIDDTERIGNDITASHMEIRYRWYNNPTLGAADQYNTCRIIYFQWRDNNALATPTGAAILRVDSANDFVNANYNFENRASFKILYDKTHIVSYTNSNASSFHHKAFVKIPHKNIKYTDVNGNQGFNHIYILIVSDSALAPHVTCMNTSRLYFRDA